MPTQPAPSSTSNSFLLGGGSSQGLLVRALAGSLLLWLAQPPASLGWPAWVAAGCWASLAVRDGLWSWLTYRKLWVAGACYWLLAVHWVRLPHPATPVGWVILAGYLGLYLPACVGLTRHAVKKLRAPLWLAWPVVWTAGEFVQANLFTGFLMGAVSHSQARFTTFVQISDTIGAYGVSFLVMLGGAAGYDFIRALRVRSGLPAASVGIASALVLLAGSLLYGRAALLVEAEHRIGPVVALVQANIEARWEFEEGRDRRVMDTYLRLSRGAIEEAKGRGEAVDLVVWPENMFRTPLVTFDGGKRDPAGTDPQLANSASYAWNDLRNLAAELGTNLVVGCDRFDAPSANPAGYRGYNSAAMVSSRGEVAAIYDKMHRVPFGEYIPLFSNIPAMYYLTPLSGGLTPGEKPVAAELGGVVYAPNICFETVVPHAVRIQVAALAGAGQRPDLLVNVTNDAWFWGSSELDMHLNCNILRCIENRTPMVVAANGGLSAVVDSWGRTPLVSPRQAEHVIVARAPLGPRGTSLYTRWGDVFALGCLALGLGLAAHAGIGRMRVRRR